MSDTTKACECGGSDCGKPYPDPSPVAPPPPSPDPLRWWTDEDVEAGAEAIYVAAGYTSARWHDDQCDRSWYRRNATAVLAALSPRVAALVADAERAGAVKAWDEGYRFGRLQQFDGDAEHPGVPRSFRNGRKSLVSNLTYAMGRCHDNPYRADEIEASR